MTNLKPERVPLLPRNWPCSFLRNFPNSPGNTKQDAGIRNNVKAGEEDGFEFLLLPCVPLLCFERYGYADPSVSMQILTVFSINIKSTDTIQLMYIPRFINRTESVLIKLLFLKLPSQGQKLSCPDLQFSFQYERVSWQARWHSFTEIQSVIYKPKLHLQSYLNWTFCSTEKLCCRTNLSRTTHFPKYQHLQIPHLLNWIDFGLVFI